MALVVLVSAAGSPGVTTTAVGLALTWPRTVLLVEADPTGGSGVLAGYGRGRVEQPHGLIDLVMAQRQDLVADTLPRVLMDLGDSPVKLLAGIRSHTQATSLPGVWDDLLGALRDLDGTGQDVIVDAGRLGVEGWARPLVLGADVTLLLTGSSLPALAASRSWAVTLREDTASARAAAGVLVVGEGRPYGAGEIRRTLGLPVVSSLVWEPPAAAVFSQGAPPPTDGWTRLLGRFTGRDLLEDRPLVRSLRSAGEAIRALAAAADPAAGVGDRASSRARGGGSR